MQAFNHNNFFIVMERGKFFYATFVDNYFVMSACSFTMQAFNHNNFFIVMERGKFFYYATFVDNYFVMSACSFTMQTCTLFHYAGF